MDYIALTSEMLATVAAVKILVDIAATMGLPSRAKPGAALVGSFGILLLADLAAGNALSLTSAAQAALSAIPVTGAAAGMTEFQNYAKRLKAAALPQEGDA